MIDKLLIIEVRKMNKNIAVALFSIIGCIILVQSGIFDALVAFLLVGAIPGTAYSIPPAFMLLLIATIGWLLIIRFAPLPTDSKKKKTAKPKKQMPRRRYSQI